MATTYVLPARGPFLEEKVVVSHQSGEILWPIKGIFEVAYGDDTKRQYLTVLDKSISPLEKLYGEIFGTDPPKLAVPGTCGNQVLVNFYIYIYIYLAIRHNYLPS